MSLTHVIELKIVTTNVPSGRTIRQIPKSPGFPGAIHN